MYLSESEGIHRDTVSTEFYALNLINVPPISRKNTHIWFAQLEVQFQHRNIHSQASKYSFVLRIMPSEVAFEVSDLTVSGPASNAYNQLKQAIIQHTFVNDEKK